MKKLTPILFLLLCTFNSYSQESAYTNYTVEDGLPSNECYDVFQDSKGYIWIATDRGVSRYNGYEFENFTTVDGLPDNVVFGFYEDEKNRIWFRTFNGELGYYSIKDREFKTPKITYKSEGGSFNLKFLNSIFLENDTLTVTTLQKQLKFIALDKSFLLLSKKKHSEAPHYQYYINQLNNFQSPYYHRTKISPNEFLFFSSYEGNSLLYCQTNKNITKQLLLKDNSVSSVKMYNKPFLGINNSIYTFEKKDTTIHKYFQSPHSISNFCKDKMGSFWISSLKNGILKYNNTKIHTSFSKQNIELTFNPT